MAESASKIILITGASRGIGLAAATLFRKAGVTLILASRDAEKAAAAAEKVGAEPLQLNITDPESIQKAAETIQNQHGKLDVLVNNSAILLDHYQSLLQLDPAILSQTLDTNVVGTLRVTQALVPLLQKASQPRIVNVSSGAGQLDGEPGAWAPAYSISKTALNMLTQQLTAALPDIITNSMCPGWCRTDMGGNEAPRSAEQGADTIVWLALEADPKLRGLFFRDREVLPW